MVVAVTAYLLEYKPLESKQQLVLEILNEITIAFLLYHVVCFSDVYNSDVANGAKDYMGYSFDVCIIANLTVHLSLLVGTYVKSIRILIRRRKCCCQRRKNNKRNKRLEM